MRSPFLSVAAVSAALPKHETETHCSASSLPTPTRSRTVDCVMQVTQDVVVAAVPAAVAIADAALFQFGDLDCLEAHLLQATPRIEHLACRGLYSKRLLPSLHPHFSSHT